MFPDFDKNWNFLFCLSSRSKNGWTYSHYRLSNLLFVMMLSWVAFGPNDDVTTLKTIIMNRTAIKFRRCNVNNTSRKLSWICLGSLNSYKRFANDFSAVVSGYCCCFGPRRGVARDAPHTPRGYRRHVSRCKRQLSLRRVPTTLATSRLWQKLRSKANTKCKVPWNVLGEKWAALFPVTRIKNFTRNLHNQFLDEIGLTDHLQLTGVLSGEVGEFFRAFVLRSFCQDFGLCAFGDTEESRRCAL